MMRPMDLDYVARSSWANRDGLLILFFAILFAGGVATLYFFQMAERQALKAQWDRLERSQKHKTSRAIPSGAAVQEVQAEIKRANEVIAQLDLPWGQLFQAVETSSQETVALLGIQPDAQKRTVNIAAESKDMSAAVAYVRRLAQEPGLSDVHIINHQVQEQDPERPLRFSVQAVWRESPPKK